jgi:hypothetical protein
MFDVKTQDSFHTHFPIKKMNTNQFYINGAWVDPIDGTDLDVINPSTEEVCATIS